MFGRRLSPFEQLAVSYLEEDETGRHPPAMFGGMNPKAWSGVARGAAVKAQREYDLWRQNVGKENERIRANMVRQANAQWTPLDQPRGKPLPGWAVLA